MFKRNDGRFNKNKTMNLYYDPILGLRYTFFEWNNFYINIDVLPAFDIQKWKMLIKNMGVLLVDTNQQPYIEEVPQITSYITI